MIFFRLLDRSNVRFNDEFYISPRVRCISQFPRKLAYRHVFWLHTSLNSTYNPIMSFVPFDHTKFNYDGSRTALRFPITREMLSSGSCARTVASRYTCICYIYTYLRSSAMEIQTIQCTQITFLRSDPSPAVLPLVDFPRSLSSAFPRAPPCRVPSLVRKRSHDSTTGIIIPARGSAAGDRSIRGNTRRTLAL